MNFMIWGFGVLIILCGWKIDACIRVCTDRIIEAIKEKKS